MVQILEQSQRTADLAFAVLLKAKTQGNGKRRADHGHDHDAVIVLHIGWHLAVDLVLDVPLHAGVATPDEGTADIDAIDGSHYHTLGHVRTENTVHLQLTRVFST